MLQIFKKIKNFISKKNVSILGFLGVLSTIAGLIQFYNIEKLPIIEGEFCLSDNNKTGRLIDLAKEISSNSDGILYFKDVVVNYYCDGGQLKAEAGYDGHSTIYSLKGTDTSVSTREESEQKVTYTLNFDGFLANKDETLNKTEWSKSLLTKYNINFNEEDIKKFDAMWVFNMSGSNIFMSFNHNDQNQNQYSTFEAGVREGGADYINGPFQIKDRSGGEHIEYELSSPTLDSGTKKQVECTRKDWGTLKTMFLCPFL